MSHHHHQSMSRQEEEEVEKKEYLGGGILGCQKAAEWGAATASIQGSQQSSTTGDSSREPFFGSGMSRQTTAASENEAQSASSSMIPVIITTTTAAAAAAAKGKVTFKSLNGVRHCKALRKWSLTTDPNQSLTFVFNYTPEVVEGFQRGTSTILLRVCQYDAGKHYQEDYLPATACISTNNGRVSSLLLLNIGTEALRRPVDLGGLLHLGSIDPKTVIAGKEPNSVVMHVFLEVMPPTSISYVAGIYLVTWFTWQELLDGFICSWPVQFGREINSSTGLTGAYNAPQRKEMAGSNGQRPYQDGTSAFLDCLHSNNRIGIPVRSKWCTHAQCFDAKEFIKHNLSRKEFAKWCCPVCYLPISLNLTLVIDGFFLRVLETAPKRASKVYFLPNGQWFYKDYYGKRL